MAIFIEVVAANGRPPEESQRVEFAEAGGSIGRAEDNHLKLPDPQRHISRYHARVTHRLSRYFILDTGSSTPVILNSIPVGNGREAEIRPGDELRIGHYLLHVNAAPEEAGTTQVARDALAVTASADHPGHRPPAAAGGRGADALSAAATVMVPAAGTAGATPPRTAPPGATSGVAPPAAVPPAAPAAAVEPAAAVMAAAPENGAAPAPGAASPAIPSSAAPSSAAPSSAPAGSAAANAAGAEHRPAAAVPADDARRPAREGPAPLPASAETVPYPPVPLDPRVIVAALKGEVAPEQEEYDPTATRPLPPGSSMAVVDMDVGDTSDDTPLRFGRYRSAAAALLDSPQLDADPGIVDVGAAAAERDVVFGTEGAAGATAASLLRALCEGAGLDESVALQGLNEQHAYALGAVVRAVAFGLREVLASDALEEDLDANPVSVPRPSRNPIVAAARLEDAVAHLLGISAKPVPDPVVSVRDAFDQLSVARRVLPAAVREAFRIAIDRFKPQSLMARAAAGKDIADSLFLGGNRAKLWVAYEESYEQNSGAIESDFRRALHAELTASAPKRRKPHP